jgi:hypothetical protein
MEEGTDQISVYLSEKKVFLGEMKGAVQSYGFTPLRFSAGFSDKRGSCLPSHLPT